MKVCVIVVLFMVFVLICCVSTYAAETYPVWEMAGVIKDIKKTTSETGGSECTYVTLQDERVIRFDGSYDGRVSANGKYCKITYQYSDTRGNHITGMKCEK